MSPSQASASPSAIAKPIPRFEPVTTATFKTNRLHNDFLIFTEYGIFLLNPFYLRKYFYRSYLIYHQVSLVIIIYRIVIEHTLPVVGCVRTKKIQKVGAEYMNICAQLYYIIKYLNCCFCFILTVGHITMHEESHLNLYSITYFRTCT